MLKEFWGKLVKSYVEEVNNFPNAHLVVFILLNVISIYGVIFNVVSN